MSNTTTLATQLDAQLTTFFSTWSLTTTLLLLTLITIIILPLFTTRDPDIHPFLLARQATASPIRQPGQSAVYRCTDTPHGYPLKSGLGVKDEGAPRWSQGRRGDLRDVWRQAVRGPSTGDGVGLGGGVARTAGAGTGPGASKGEIEYDASQVGKVLTVLGREKVITHEMGEVTGQINAVGSWMKKQGVGKVAVCLSNSVEVLVLIFAASFYDLSITLIPYGLPDTELGTLLSQTNANVLVTEAGTFNVDAAFASNKNIKHVILATRGFSEHMAFDEPPQDAPKGTKVVTWTMVVDAAKSQGTKLDEVLAVDKESTTKPLSTFVAGEKGYQLVEFSSENIIAGIAGLNATAVRNQKLSHSDILLPTTSLTDPYTLCWVLAALFSNASIALNSVAGEKVDLALATAGITPTIIVAAPQTVKTYLFDIIKSGLGPGSTSRYFQGRSLASGVMPSKRPLVKLTSLAKLRLLLIGQPVSQKVARLTSSELHELRLVTGARIGYALTAAEVAGAVAQTNIQDYRDKGEVISVGPPVGSVEVYVIGEEEVIGTANPHGKVVVKGPAVVGGKVDIGCEGKIGDDNTLSLL